MLAASTDVASVVGKGVAEKQHPDKISADAYQAIWGKQNRGQRDFQVRHYTSLYIINIPYNCVALHVAPIVIF
jgi:hypothetical protein